VFVGGVLTTFLGWRWVFFVNVPVLAAVIAGGALVLPRARPSRPSVRRFDVPGAVAVSAGAMLVVLAFAQAPAFGWADPATWLPAGVGLTLLGAFLWIEHRATSPLMPLALLRRGTLYGAMLVAAAFMASLGLQFFFLTMYLQSALHQTALAAGVSVLPLAGAIFAGNEVGGRLATRFGARRVLPFGLAMGGFGLLMYAFLGASGYVPVLVAGEIIAGLGQGVAFSTVYIIAASGVESGRQGVASAMTSTAQFLGGSIGLALLVDVLTSRLPGSSAGTPTLDGGSIPGLLSALHWAFAAQAVIALAGTLVAALVIGRTRIEHGNEGTVAVAA
jgi:MFS family permease